MKTRRMPFLDWIFTFFLFLLFNHPVQKSFMLLSIKLLTIRTLVKKKPMQFVFKVEMKF